MSKVQASTTQPWTEDTFPTDRTVLVRKRFTPELCRATLTNDGECKIRGLFSDTGKNIPLADLKHDYVQYIECECGEITEAS